MEAHATRMQAVLQAMQPRTCTLRMRPQTAPHGKQTGSGAGRARGKGLARAPSDHWRRPGVRLRRAIQQVMGIQLVKGCSALYSILGSTYTFWYHSAPTPSVAAAQAHTSTHHPLCGDAYTAQQACWPGVFCRGADDKKRRDTWRSKSFTWTPAPLLPPFVCGIGVLMLYHPCMLPVLVAFHAPGQAPWLFHAAMA